MDRDELRGRNRAREHEMLTQAKNEILRCGDFLPVTRLAQHLNTRAETLTPALVEWEVDNRIFRSNTKAAVCSPVMRFPRNSASDLTQD